MKNRLSLTIDSKTVHRAKRLARQSNKSLSGLVEELLIKSISNQTPTPATKSFSERWNGKLSIDRKDEPRFRQLAEKHDLS